MFDIKIYLHDCILINNMILVEYKYMKIIYLKKHILIILDIYYLLLIYIFLICINF